MVWGCISIVGPGRLYRIDGTMNSQKYVSILKDNLLPSIKEHGFKRKQVYFQQDNAPKHAPKHTSKFTKSWLEKKKLAVLLWPPNSPDMNIIEHVWDHLDRMVRARDPLPRNKQQLWAALQEEWEAIRMD